MHSAGLELTKLTYTRLEDNLIRHRGDRSMLNRPRAPKRISKASDLRRIIDSREGLEMVFPTPFAAVETHFSDSKKPNSTCSSNSRTKKACVSRSLARLRLNTPTTD